MVTGALVERVLLEADEEVVRATGVAYRTEHGTHEEVAAGTEVVLCAGAIGSPHSCCSPGSEPATSWPPSGSTASSTSRTSGATSRTTSTHP